MNLNFSNYYVFTLTAGISGLLIGIDLFKISYWFAILTFLSVGLIYFSLQKWSNSQIINDKKSKREFDMIDTKISFNIDSVTSKNDVDFEPEGYDEDRQPFGLNVFPVVEIKFVLRAFNPSTLKTAIKSAKLDIVQNSEIKLMELEHFVPVSIPPRDSELVTLFFFCRDFTGKPQDVLKLTLESIDGELFKLEHLLTHYSRGPNLIDEIL
jgi:hypothetical protein